MSTKSYYLAFLIRLQRGHGQRYWRVTLRDVQSQEILHFATEHDLIRHLLTILSETGAEETQRHDGGSSEA